MSLHQNTSSLKTLTPFKSDLNSAVDMSTATQFHLSVNFEWLKGCQFNCKGCHVNKEGGVPYTETQLFQLRLWVENMRDKGGYLPTIAFIGPTDYLTAENTIDILTDIRIWSVLRYFKRLSLQTTYLNIDRIDEIKKILHEGYSHMELELNFVIEPEQIGNAKYLQRIKDNRDRVHEVLQWPMPISSFCILNVYEYDRIKKNNVKRLLSDYRQLDELIKEQFGCTIDFNFSMTRNSWWSNDDVAEAIRSVSRVFDEGVSHEFNNSVRFSFGKLTDSLIEKHYNWHDGSLYISPMLYERIASFHPSLRIPMTKFSVEETESFEEEELVKQYAGLPEKECSTCPYRASCIDRNVLTFMDMHEIKRCIMARKALDAINKLT